MTKNTNTPQLIVNNPTMSISSTSSTFLVRDLKIENAKLDTKSSEEGKTPVVPNIVVVTNNKNDTEEGWTDITKGNRKAKSSGNGTGVIVTEIYDQQLSTPGHGNILSSTTPTTDRKTEKKKKKQRKKSTHHAQSKSPTSDFDDIDLSQTSTLNYEEKKEVMKLHALKYRPDSRSSKAKPTVTKATNHKDIASGVKDKQNHGKQTDSYNGQSKAEKNSVLSQKDQTFGRGGGIKIGEDVISYHNNRETGRSAMGSRGGGSGRGRGRQGGRGRGLRTTTKYDINNNINTSTSGTTYIKSQPSGSRNDGNTTMSGICDREDDDIVNEIGDGNN